MNRDVITEGGAPCKLLLNLLAPYQPLYPRQVENLGPFEFAKVEGKRPCGQRESQVPDHVWQPCTELCHVDLAVVHLEVRNEVHGTGRESHRYQELSQPIWQVWLDNVGVRQAHPTAPRGGKRQQCVPI